MSRKKRKTMRGLKRVLGVSAIILALLIAAIPDVGRAQTKDGSTKSQAEGGGIALLSLEPDMGGLPGDGEIDPGTGGSEGGEMLPGAGDSAEDGWADPQAGDTEAGEETGPDEPQEAYPMLLAPAEPDADAGESENPSVTPEETEQLPSLGVTDGAWKPGVKKNGEESQSVYCQDERGAGWHDAMSVCSDTPDTIYVLASDKGSSDNDVISEMAKLKGEKDDTYDTGAGPLTIARYKSGVIDDIENQYEGTAVIDVTVALPFSMNNPQSYYRSINTGTMELYGQDASGSWKPIETHPSHAIPEDGSDAYWCMNFTLNSANFGNKFVWFCYEKKASEQGEGQGGSQGGGQGEGQGGSQGGGQGEDPEPPVDLGKVYEFNVEDTNCYSAILGKGGAYGSMNSKEYKKGIWTLTIEDTSNPSLVAACQDPIIGMPSNAEYKMIALTDFYGQTADGDVNFWPSDATVTLSLPVPKAADTPKLAKAASYDVRGYDNAGNAALIAEAVKPAADKVNKTSYKYIDIPIEYRDYKSLDSGKQLIIYESTAGSTSSDAKGKEKGIEVDTPKDDEEMAAGTTDDVSTLWGLKEPTATVKVPDDVSDDVTKYRLLITRYSDLKAATIDDKIKKDKAITGYKSNSKIDAYEMKIHMIGGRGETYPYPTTPEELENRTFNITLYYQKAKAGKVNVYTLKNGSSLERLAGPVSVAAGTTTKVTFTATHFSQFALLYTPDTVTPTPTPDPSPSGGSTSSSQASSKASTASSSASNSSSNTGASNNNNGSSNNSNNNSSNTGGGGNSASGNGRVDMPRTADATTYKAIIILILLAFGAFELISSLPAKKQTAGRG